MRKVIYGFAVALLTFALGAVSYYLTRPKAAPSTPTKPVVVSYELKPVEITVKETVDRPANDDLALIISTDNGGESGQRTIKLGPKTTVIDDLDVPENIDGQELFILGGAQSEQYRISERYRTSMTVMGEGPHLDLIDWRHFDSEWIPLEKLSQRKFRSIASEKMDVETFPATTRAELLSAVRKRAVAIGWEPAIDLAKTCRSPKDEPCAVSVSSVYFRIERLVGDTWVKVGSIEISIPMGC